uniref:SDR family NAD(P)-dependent oxidoreductase n=1 Tax=uncultured Pseudomonas sp. TaxID=114707 RepID=UPI0030DCE0F2
MQHNEFDNRLAVVTGASSGIGYALTTGLLQAGARVLAMSRHQGELGALQEHYGEGVWGAMEPKTNVSSESHR